MNVFPLSRDPFLAAKFLCDKHIVKMCVESAQMLSTVFRIVYGVLGEVLSIKNGKEKVKIKLLLPDHGEFSGMWGKDRNPNVYWDVHHKHPCTIWTERSTDNWDWHVKHALSMCKEYTKRYGKQHKSESVIRYLSQISPDLDTVGLTKFPLAMPDKYKGDSAVLSYRRYYLGDKSKFAKWEYTNPPYWWIEDKVA